MAYFFDGAVIMILIVTALTGYCKGFVRYVITMLGTVAAVLVAFLIANMSAENVYNKYFKTQLITSLENAAEQTDLSKLVSNELKNEGVDIDLSDEEIKNVLSGAGTLAENTEKLLVSKGTDLDTAQQKGEELSEYIHSVMPQKLSEKLEGNKLGKSLSKAVKLRIVWNYCEASPCHAYKAFVRSLCVSGFYAVRACGNVECSARYLNAVLALHSG